MGYYEQFYNLESIDILNLQVFYFVIFGLYQDFFPIIEFKEPLNLA